MLTACLITTISLLAQPHTRVSWTDPGRCGTNCLYSLLHLAGQNADYQALAAEIPLVNPAQGVTLAELVRVAKSHDLDAVVLKVRPEEIAGLPTPFILHLDLADVGGTGHFVTVYEVLPEGGPDIFYIDGGTGTAMQRGLGDLEPLITGYVLAISPKGSFGLPHMPTLAIIFVAVLLALPLALAAFRICQRGT